MIQCVCVFYMQYQSESWFNSGEGDPPFCMKPKHNIKQVLDSKSCQLLV